MALYPVGVSSFGELRGRTQYVTSSTVAAQVRSLIAESAGAFTGGAVLSVNEGVRSKPDQEAKLAAWQRYVRGGPWAPLAASPLYTSTHDESRGSALDFGVTMPDGRNRAMTMSEQSWVVKRGRQRGIRWTGADFRPTPEPWHFNGGYPAELAPLASPASSGGAVIIPDTQAPAALPETDLDMIVYGHEHGTQAAASPGRWEVLTPATAPAAILESGRPVVPVLAKDWDALRDRWLHRGDTNVYALTDAPAKDAHYVVGPGVYFQLDKDTVAEYQARLGSRIPVSTRELAIIRRTNGA